MNPYNSYSVVYSKNGGELKYQTTVNFATKKEARARLEILKLDCRANRMCVDVVNMKNRFIAYYANGVTWDCRIIEGWL